MGSIDWFKIIFHLLSQLILLIRNLITNKLLVYFTLILNIIFSHNIYACLSVIIYVP